MNAPCRNCQERTPDCHAVCERYQEYADENRKLRNKRYADKQVDNYQNEKKIENAVWKAKHSRRR